MASLRQPKTSDEIKRLTVAKVKEEYNKLAIDYNKIINLEYMLCPECGEWKSTEKSFYGSSTIKTGINYHMCKSCVLENSTDYDKKMRVRSDNKAKTIETFRRMDWCFDEHDYIKQVNIINEGVGERVRGTAVQQLIVMVRSLPQYVGKTFKDSIILDEEMSVYGSASAARKPRKEIIRLFGEGFSTEDYLYLQDQYDDWRTRTQVDTKSQETYVIQICFILLDIYKARKMGKDTDKLFKSLNEATQAANLQPRQNVSNSSTDSLTLGQLIEKWENEKPIPEPDPEFQDVDGIKKYINVFFKGHLAKMMGLKNAFSTEYDEYMEKYTVHKPTYEEDSCSEEIREKLFGKEIE